MEYTLISFLLNNEGFRIKLNSNILDSNLINILFLVALLFYVNQVTFRSTLAKRKKDIAQIIENAQEDVLQATTYYSIAEKNFEDVLFSLCSLKTFYKENKMASVRKKYNLVKEGFTETFVGTENLIKIFEKKTFLKLQRYLFFTLVSKWVRFFVYLPEKDQSDFLKNCILKLKGVKNERKQ